MRTLPHANGHLDESADLVAAISTSPQAFLQPTPTLHATAVLAAKRLLDPLASEVAALQNRRRDERRQKRKREEYDGHETVLQLRQIHTAGFGVHQIWEQGRRILHAANEEVSRDLEDGTGVGDAKGDRSVQILGERLEDFHGEGAAWRREDVDDQAGELSPNNTQNDWDDEMGEEADIGDDEDIEDGEEVEARNDESASDVGYTPESYVEDPNGLNDGFFSIDDFNKQSQFLEQQDARGEDDHPSDEDEVDWDADPLALPLGHSKQNSRPNLAGEDKWEDDDEGGPTFGDADLNAGDSEEEDGILEDGDLDPMAGLANTNDIKYSDFFQPPPKKPSKTKRMRALPKTQPPKANLENRDADMQRAISDVRRDLFESEEEVSDEDLESGSEPDAPRAKNHRDRNLSTHEKQRAKIAAEIRRLEAANVAKRDWTLSGEARAADRPMNSLIEEDLEFERAGKPVPVITAEVSEEIEQLIKRRIIAREFDEVIRRRPEAIGAASETRRGRVEIDDTKPQQGLADEYEQEHLKSTDPGYVDRRSEATKKQHAEIDRLWKEVSSQLDLLSNLHFKPKRVEAEIKTVEDKPVISMEDARPVGVGGEESMLAPQEIYRPGEDGKVAGEVVRKHGANVSKEELTREEKLRRRRREKERQKKAKGSNATVAAQKQGRKDGKKSKKAEQEDILTQLKKGGVKVIGKKGEMEELGKKRSGHSGGQSGSALKL
jgi:U3 small nucleolar RNA-associated protein MPP10